MDKDLRILGGVILDVPNLDLALVIGLDDALDQIGGSRTERDLVDDQRLVILLSDPSSRTYATTALPFLSLIHI